MLFRAAVRACCRIFEFLRILVCDADNADAVRIQRYRPMRTADQIENDRIAFVRRALNDQLVSGLLRRITGETGIIIDI